MNNRYLVVSTLKSGTKMRQSSWLYIQDILFIGGIMFAGFLLQDSIYGPLFIPFEIFNGFVAVMLVKPSRFNAKKKYWQSLYLYMSSITDIYYPLKNASQNEYTKNFLREIENDEES